MKDFVQGPASKIQKISFSGIRQARMKSCIVYSDDHLHNRDRRMGKVTVKAPSFPDLRERGAFSFHQNDE